jgi:mRNA deadenylase 3'-5' endonuclease subunit Ccr4
MEECGYSGHHTPTDISGKHGRVDSCALYYRTDSWKSVIVESIRLDDLATLCTKNRAGNFSASTRASLIGIESSFLRKNMALLVRLQHLETRQEIVVAVSHLFWNPLYQDVKAGTMTVVYMLLLLLQWVFSPKTVDDPLSFPVTSCCCCGLVVSSASCSDPCLRVCQWIAHSLCG